jgi:hypothetical protein
MAFRGQGCACLQHSLFHAKWGRVADTEAFWRACLTHTPLQDVMALLDADGVTVP